MWGTDMLSWRGHGWVGAWPFHLIWVGLVVAGLLFLFRREPIATRHRRVGEDRAAAILRERYAHGEIDQAEFEEAMRRFRE